MSGYFHDKLAAERAKTAAVRKEATVALAHARQQRRPLTDEGITEDRLAHLTWAASALSTGGYVLIRQGEDRESRVKQWRVNVRYKDMEHTATATPALDRNPFPALVLAMDRAVQWLRAACVAHAPAPLDPYRRHDTSVWRA